MKPKQQIKETAPFVQFSSVETADAFNPLFDVEKTQNETLETYCQALFTKAFSQNNSNIPEFLNHHCGKVKEPLVWLNKFEKLITENEHLFNEARRDTKLTKFQTCIELKRNDLKSPKSPLSPQRPLKKQINAESEERYFSFKETKSKAEQMSDDRDKVYYLTTEIFEYKTADIEMKNSKLPEFDAECEKLIGKIQTLAKMKAEMEKEKNSENNKGLKFNKIKLNCNVNQLVDLFYQLQYELFTEGKPFIDGSKNDIVAVICNSFLDKDGRDISPQTVSTILKPSKEEKRPNTGKRIDLDKLL